MAIYGFTRQDISSLVPLARFWNYPPELKINSGAGNSEYSQAQKAYILDASGESISFSISASESSPLQNPCFVIGGMDKEDIQLSMNGLVLKKDEDFRYGFVAVEGGYKLVVWLKTQSSQKTDIVISKK